VPRCAHRCHSASWRRWRDSRTRDELPMSHFVAAPAALLASRGKHAVRRGTPACSSGPSWRRSADSAAPACPRHWDVPCILLVSRYSVRLGARVESACIPARSGLCRIVSVCSAPWSPVLLAIAAHKLICLQRSGGSCCTYRRRSRETIRLASDRWPLSGVGDGQLLLAQLAAGGWCKLEHG
jgi:hypothetical protein